MDITKIKTAYNNQKQQAKLRGIEWKLTFDQWVAWWGDDIDRRGSKRDQLQMQRLHDKGAYELGNIKKGYPIENAKTMGNCRRLRNSLKRAERHQQDLDALMYVKCEDDDEDYVDEYTRAMAENAVFTKPAYARDK